MPAMLLGILGCGLASAPAQAAVTTPMESGVSTSSDSWVTLPMGDLSDPSNTFWELFHGIAGSTHWSLVTPPGVADNGGLVESASAGAVVAGVVPSGLLRFSPLAQSAQSGGSWTPAFLPGALAPLPDALAYDTASTGGAIALLARNRALRAPTGLSSWSPLVTAAALQRILPACGVNGLDGAAFLPTGVPLIATGCRQGGRVGLFTLKDATWQNAGPALTGPLRGAATTVLRVQSTGTTTTVLVLASRGGRRDLVAMWKNGSGTWAQAEPLAVGSRTTVRSTAVNSAGDVAVLLGGAPQAADIAPGGQWNRLPRPPRGPLRLRSLRLLRPRAESTSTPSRLPESRSACSRSPLRSRHGPRSSRARSRWLTARRAKRHRGTVTERIPAEDGRAA